MFCLKLFNLNCTLLKQNYIDCLNSINKSCVQKSINTNSIAGNYATLLVPNSTINYINFPFNYKDKMRQRNTTIENNYEELASTVEFIGRSYYYFVGRMR